MNCRSNDDVTVQLLSVLFLVTTVCCRKKKCVDDALWKKRETTSKWMTMKWRRNDDAMDSSCHCRCRCLCGVKSISAVTVRADAAIYGWRTTKDTRRLETDKEEKQMSSQYFERFDSG